MGRAERIVIALGPFGETGKPATGAQGADAIAAPGQDLVRIGLMANVPDQAIAGRVEDVVDGRRQFDDTEAGAEMSAGDRDGVDGFLAQLIGDLLDLLDLESAQIVGGLDGVQKRRFAKCGHSDIPILQVGTSSDVRRVRGISAAKTQAPAASWANRSPI